MIVWIVNAQIYEDAAMHDQKNCAKQIINFMDVGLADAGVFASNVKTKIFAF